MEQGTTNLDKLRAHLRARRDRAWISVVAGPAVDGGATPLLHAQVVVGVRPRAWREETWTYGQCTFSACTMSPAKAGSMFASAGPQQLAIGSLPVLVELADTNVQWQRQPSLARYDELALPWPSTAYRVAMVDQTNLQPPNGYLIGDGDTPSFPTFGAAFNAFFHGDFAVSGTSNPQLGQVAVRLVEGRARISRARIRPASLDVWVGGRGLGGTRLELNGAEYRSNVELAKGGRVTLPLPSGLPSDAWLWLKDGTEWLDFRSLGGWGGQRSPDVETELPQDPIADLSRLAAQGEGAHLEYKEKLPDTQGEKRNVFKTVVAFANGDGGTVLFGIGDGGERCGLKDRLPEARRRLNDLLRDLVTPSPQAHIAAHRLDGCNIVVLDVGPGNGVLHALTLDANKPEYYVRRDGTTYYARPEEIAAVIKGGEPSPALPWFAQP